MQAPAGLIYSNAWLACVSAAVALNTVASMQWRQWRHCRRLPPGANAQGGARPAGPEFRRGAPHAPQRYQGAPGLGQVQHRPDHRLELVVTLFKTAPAPV